MYGIELEWATKKWGYDVDERVWEECDDDSYKIPLDDRLCLVRLLRISSWEDIVVSSDYESDTCDDRYDEEEHWGEFPKEKCRG